MAHQATILCRCRCRAECPGLRYAGYFGRHRSLVVDGIVSDLTGIPYGTVVRDTRIVLGEPSAFGPEEIQRAVLEPPDEVTKGWSLVAISLYPSHEEAITALRAVRTYPLAEDKVKEEGYFVSYAVQRTVIAHRSRHNRATSGLS